MPITWFKLPHSLPGERWLSRFRPEEKWAWVALLCQASQEKTRGMISEIDDDDMASVLGLRDASEWRQFREKLVQKGAIEFSGVSTIRILDWEEKYGGRRPSDEKTPARDRQRRCRQRKRERDSAGVAEVVPSAVTGLEASGEVDVTRCHALDLDLDLDLDLEPDLPKISNDRSRSRAFSAPPENAGEQARPENFGLPGEGFDDPEPEGEPQFLEQGFTPGSELATPDPWLRFGGKRSAAFEALISEMPDQDGRFAIEAAIDLDQDWQEIRKKSTYKGLRPLTEDEIRAFLDVFNKVKPELWQPIAIYYGNGNPRRLNKDRSKAIQDWFNRFGSYAIAMLRFGCWCCEKSDLFSNRKLGESGSDYEFSLDWMLGQNREHVSRWMSQYLSHLEREVQKKAQNKDLATQWQDYIDSLPDEESPESPIEGIHGSEDVCVEAVSCG